MRTLTLDQLHALTPKGRRNYFKRATAEQCEGLFVPCTGEAHGNAHIDHCMQCLGYDWGIAPAPLPR